MDMDINKDIDPNTKKKVRFSADILTIEIPRYDESRRCLLDEFTYKFECDKCGLLQNKTFYFGRCSCDIYVCKKCHSNCGEKM